MKKKLVLIILLVVSLLACVTVFANASNNIHLIVNGKEISPDTPPQIINDRTMVSVRFVAEALGLKVDWDDESSSVIITGNSNNDINQSEFPEFFTWVANAQSLIRKTDTFNDIDDESTAINRVIEMSDDLDALINASKTLNAPPTMDGDFHDLLITCSELKMCIDLSLRAFEEAHRGNKIEADVLIKEAGRILDNINNTKNIL